MKTKTFVQFFQKSCISDNLIPACGDRSVIILDARSSPAGYSTFCASECKSRKYQAWQICRGTFSRYTPLTEIVVV